MEMRIGISPVLFPLSHLPAFNYSTYIIDDNCMETTEALTLNGSIGRIKASGLCSFVTKNDVSADWSRSKV